MKPQRLLLLALVLSSQVALADIGADKQKCPDEKHFVFTQAGGCVRRARAAAASSEAKYQQALDVVQKDPKLAFTLFNDACKRKHAAACLNVGAIYRSGRARVVTKDTKRAVEFYQRACELGNGRGCQRAGNEILDTDGKAARVWLDKGCSKSDGTACAQVGFAMDRGIGGPEDKQGAQQYFAKARKLLGKCKGNGEACWVRGYLAEKGIGEKADEAKAAAAYKEACGESYNDGCFFYAKWLDRTGGSDAVALEYYERSCQFERADGCTIAAGRIADVDYQATRPMELAQRACELDTQHCYTLARLFELGRGGLAKPDNVRATATFKSACDAGDQDSCISYAKRIRGGNGATANKPVSEQLMQRACDAGEAKACEQLSIWLIESKADDGHAYQLAAKGCTLGSRHACYVQGWAFWQNRRGKDATASEADAARGALPWFTKACEQGSMQGCEAVGKLHRTGTGIPKDEAKARKAFESACFSEHDPQGYACLTLSQMAKAGEGAAIDAKLSLKAGARACAYGQAEACMPLMSVKAAEDVALIANEIAPKCRVPDETACQWEANVRSLGTTDDKKRALEIFAASCKRKVQFACVREGDLVNEGIGTKADPARAEQIWSELCDDTMTDACTRLMRATYNRKEYDVSLKWADKACTQGGADACSAAGYFYMTAQKPVPWDVRKGGSYYEKACERGSAIGCSNYAALFKFGIGRPLDPEQAYTLYQKACDGGSMFGCEGAAYYIARGEGGASKDAHKAIEILRKACEDENEPSARGCIELGALLEQEKQGPASEIARVRLKGFTNTEKEAVTNPSYMYWLATYHRDGIATMKNPAKALELFEKACEGFWPLACIEAGKTLSASPDPTARERGRAYYERACAAGVEDGCKGFTAEAGPAAGPTPVAKTARGCGVAGGGELSLVAFGLAVLGFRRRRRRRA